MTDYPLPTLAAQVTDTGITAPPFSDIFASLQASYKTIFGSDTVLEPSSQDGQWIAVIAQAISDSNNMAIGVFNAFSPATAKGTGLSSQVKINGIQRLIPSNSTADLTLVGDTGTILTDAIAIDVFNNQWALPSPLVFPNSGLLISTAVCTTAGAITAAPGTIIKIGTPTRGWQSVTNVAQATVGNPVESDATLRKRQTVSTSLPALSVLDAIVGQIANLPGVSDWAAYENDSDLIDGNGIPGHTISLVVEGGDSFEIASVIAEVKTPGTGTFGSISEVITDPKGLPNTIKFFRPTVDRIVVTVNLIPLAGYLSTTADAIQQSLADFVSSSGIGQDVEWSKLFTPANLSNVPLSYTYNITSITLALFGNTQLSVDVPIAFNAVAHLDIADVVVNV